MLPQRRADTRQNAGMKYRSPLRREDSGSARELWLVAGDAFDDFLIAAAQLDDIAIRVADENRDLTAVTKTDGTLGYRDVVRLQGGDCRRDGGDPEGHVGVAGILLRSIHQHIRSRITRIGVEDQVELDAIFVADDSHVIVLGSVQEAEPQCPIEIERTIEIAHSNADVIDPLDRDRLAHGHLLQTRTAFGNSAATRSTKTRTVGRRPCLYGSGAVIVECSASRAGNTRPRTMRATQLGRLLAHIRSNGFELSIRRP